MKRTHLIAALVTTISVGIVADDASAMYNPSTGTFMQREPGAAAAMRIGGGDAAPVGQFVPRDQYADGMNLYGYVGSNPVNWVDWTGNGKEKPGKEGGTSPGSPGTPATGTHGSVGPPEPPAGEGATCGIVAKRSAICTLSPKANSDYGHEWITDGTGNVWDFPGGYFASDPATGEHEWDSKHPMYIWTAHVTYWGGTLPNGTPCKQASCRHIKACLQEAEDGWERDRQNSTRPYDFLNHSCIDFASYALKRCCMAKGVFPTRSPGFGEEQKACCEREQWYKANGYYRRSTL